MTPLPHTLCSSASEQHVDAMLERQHTFIGTLLTSLPPSRSISNSCSSGQGLLQASKLWFSFIDDVYPRLCFNYQQPSSSEEMALLIRASPATDILGVTGTLRADFKNQRTAGEGWGEAVLHLPGLRLRLRQAHLQALLWNSFHLSPI